jgi:hypothetical protein
VLTIDRWRTDLDVADRYAAILDALTDHLMAADEAPTRGDLIRVGLRASNRHVKQEMHHHGYDPQRSDLGPGTLAGFQRYWQRSGHSPWDDRLVERLAIHQIWPLLTVAQQQAVMALALTGDHEAAADMLGLTLGAFSGRLKNARRVVYGLWHEHETPPRRRRMDKRVLSRTGTWQGRRLLTERDLDDLRARIADGETRRDLASEVGYSPGALSNLLNGKRRAAAA